MNTLLKRNVIANFFGRGWAAALNLALIPIYGRLLGIEAIALIGIYSLLNQTVNLLDLGLSPTLAREAARLTSSGTQHTENGQDAALDHLPGSHSEADARELRNLVRTVEIVYWPIAIVIAVGLALIASPVAHHWIRPSASLPPATVQHALTLMGLSLAVQWPNTLYSGALTGLHRQVLLNVVTAACGTVQGAGALIVLHFTPTVSAFFVWQTGILGLQTVLLAAALHFSLPGAGIRAVYQGELLLRLWRYAAGMMGITALGFVLTSMDKFVLSRQLSMISYGYYTLAYTAAGGLYFIIAPLYTAYFPHFVNVLTRGGRPAVITLFHQACQVMAVCVLPAAAVLAVFAPQVMLAWTNSRNIAASAGPLLRLLTISFGLFGLMHIPLAVLLAAGETKLVFRHNLVSALLAFPAMLWAAKQIGAPGVVAVWICVNVGYLLVMAPMILARLMPDELARWGALDVLMPAIVSAGCAVLLRMGMAGYVSPASGRVGLALCLAAAWAVTAAACALCLPSTRAMIVRRLPASLPTG